jgi:hypothetical protein
MRPISSRLSYANVVASLALFIALGGASYAATQLPRNSVGSAQLKAGAVANVDLAQNAVTGAKVKTGSLDGTDLKAASVGAAQLNVAGLPAVPAATTAATATVATGLAKVSFKSATVTVPVGGNAPATATCDPGQVVVGGGATLENDNDQFVNDTHPQGTNAWTALAFNSGGAAAPRTMTVYAICVPGTAG